MTALDRVRRDVDLLAGRVDADDPEELHIDADQIMAAALASIANGCANPRQVAREAGKVNDLHFPRWYA